MKVSGLSNKRAKQSDPRLQWIMFHKICVMYRDVKEEEKNANKITESRFTSDEVSKTTDKQSAAEILLDFAMSNDQSAKKMSPGKLLIVKQEITKEEAAKTLAELTIIPKDLADIQPRLSQCWNCDKIGLDPNGNWVKIVCTYKWCPAERMWKAQTGERAPFWVTLLLFTRADGQCFIPPMVIHQSSEHTYNYNLYIPSDWIVHITKS